MNSERRSRSGRHVLCDAISMVTSRSASRAAHAPLFAPDDAPSSLMMVDRSVLEARLAEDHQGWSLRRPVREKLASFFYEDGVDPFVQWPSEDHRPLWEAAFEEAIEGHSRSSKLQFLGWLEARGTLSTQEGDTPDVTLAENISPGAEEVGGDGAMEMAAAAAKEVAPQTVVIPALKEAQYVGAATAFVVYTSKICSLDEQSWWLSQQRGPGGHSAGVPIIALPQYTKLAKTSRQVRCLDPGEGARP